MDTDMANWILNKFRNARKLAEYSQADVAEELGVSTMTISNWENRVSEPRGEHLNDVIAWIERIEQNSRPRGVGDSEPARSKTSFSRQANTASALQSLRRIYTLWPQSRIAEALSVSQTTVSNWLRTGSVAPEFGDTLRQLESELNAESPKLTRSPNSGEPNMEERRYSDWLRNELDRQDLNAVKLAKKSRVHVTTILALLEGRTERPQQRTRERISEALQAPGAPAEEPIAVDDTWYYTGLEWTKEEIDQVPDKPGVYIIHDRLGRPAYVGVAHKGKGGIRARLKHHDEMKWTADRRVAYSFSYALAERMPHSDPSELAKALEKLLIKFMGNAILINRKEIEDIAE